MVWGRDVAVDRAQLIGDVRSNLAGLRHGNLGIPLLLLVMLAGLYFGSRMMHGRQPPMVYQFAFSAAVVLVSSSLTTSEPGYAVLTRVVLTLGGAVAAALLTALLEKLLIPGAGRSRTAAAQARPG